MGRTLPSVTQVFLKEQESFLRFRRALRRSDQKALDDLFAAAHKTPGRRSLCLTCPAFRSLPAFDAAGGT